MTGRWCNCPAKKKDISMHITIRDRINRWWKLRHKETPDVFMVTGYHNPVWVRH